MQELVGRFVVTTAHHPETNFSHGYSIAVGQEDTDGPEYTTTNC
jgi:hypothetical protein